MRALYRRTFKLDDRSFLDQGLLIHENVDVALQTRFYISESMFPLGITVLPRCMPPWRTPQPILNSSVNIPFTRSCDLVLLAVIPRRSLLCGTGARFAHSAGCITGSPLDHDEEEIEFIGTRKCFFNKNTICPEDFQ